MAAKRINRLACGRTTPNQIENRVRLRRCLFLVYFEVLPVYILGGFKAESGVREARDGTTFGPFSAKPGPGAAAGGSVAEDPPPCPSGTEWRVRDVMSPQD